MLTLTSATAATVAMHAPDGVWIMFVQAASPGNPYGPIKIEAVHSTQFSERLVELANDNPFELRLIGLAQNENINVDEIYDAFATTRLHGTWFSPSADLLAFIAQQAQDAINTLSARTLAGAVDGLVDIEEVAALLGVSVPTVRRMIKDGRIPFLKFGRSYRFVPADVIASLELSTQQHHGR